MRNNSRSFDRPARMPAAPGWSPGRALRQSLLIALLGFIGVVLGLTPRGLAGEVGVFVRNADKLTAEIDAGGADEDAYAVELAEGGRFDVTIKAAKGTTLLPTIRAFAPSGAERPVSALTKGAGKSKVALKKLVPAAGETGTWRIVVAGSGGSSGAYLAAFKVKAPKSSKTKGVAVPAGGTTDLTFTADDAALLTLTLKEKAGGPLTSVRVLAAGGAVIATADAFTRKGSKLFVKSLPVPDGSGYGTYTVELGADIATTVDLTAKVKFASFTKRKETLPPESRATSLDPTLVRQGDAAVQVVVTGENLLSGSDVTVDGVGVVLRSLTRESATRAVLTFDVAADAPFGPRTLVWCPPPLLGEPQTLVDALRVDAPDPVLGALSVTTLRQGAAGQVVTLSGSGFRDGGSLVVAGSGVSVSGVTVLADDMLQATLTALTTAAVGARTITYSQPLAGGGASDDAPAALTVLHPVPAVDSVDVTVLRQEDAGVVVTLTGDGFRDGGAVSFGAGVTVTATQVVSAQTLRATVSVAAAATFGARTVTYTQPAAGGGDVATLPGAVTIEAPVPTVASVDPVEAAQGVTRTLTVTGTGFRSGGVLTIEGGGADVALGTTSIVSGTQATVSATFDIDATPGARDVIYTQPAAGGARSATATDALAVVYPSPVLDTLVPTFVRQGDAVGLVATGSGFRDGMVPSLSGTGTVVSGVDVVSGTRVEFLVTAADDALVGNRSLTLAHAAAFGGRSATTPDALVVRHPEPTLTDVSPTTMRQEATGVVLTLTGTGFRTGATVDLGTGITVTDTQRVSDTSFLVTVDVAAAAAFGDRDVTYTQPLAGGGDDVTLAAAVRVDAPVPTVAEISPTIVLQGASAVDVTVTGTGFRTGATASISGTGVTVQSTAFVSATELTARLDIGAAADVGTRDVIVTQPVAGGGDAATLDDALSVHAPAPTVTAVSGGPVTRGQTGVTLTLTGTNFRADGTVTISGTGVTVSSTNLLSATSLQAIVDVTAAATLGTRDVTYTHTAVAGGASGTATAALQVNAPTPTIGSINPTTLRQGATGAALIVTGTGFADGGVITISGTGLTLGSTSVGSATSATVSVTVSDTATIGTRNVTFTQPAIGGGAAATASNALTIAHPIPTVTAATPVSVEQGDSGTFTLTGTGFRDGGSVTTTGTGITLTSPTFVSTTSFQVSYAASAGATLSARNLTYQQPSAGSSATLTNAYTVVPEGPVVTSVAPAFARPGDSRTEIIVIGSNFLTGIVASVSGSGVTVHTTDRKSGTELVVELSVASDAAVGLRNLILTPSGGSAKSFTNAFAVTPADPIVTAFSHTSLARGASGVAVTITGANFRTGASVTASGTGVTFASVTRTSSTTLTASATVTAGATLGDRDLTVTHAAADGGRSGSLDDAFEVIGAAPTVTAVAPATLGRTGSSGPSRTYSVKVQGTNFMTGAAATITKSGGSGLTVESGSVVVRSATEIVLDLTVAGTTTTGTWNVLVTNPSSLGNSGTSGNNKLTIASESTLTVNAVLPAGGSTYGGERVTIHGAGFSVGDVVDFGSVRAGGTQVIDANTLVTTVPQPTAVSRTAPTDVDVKVVSGGSNATLAKGWRYAIENTRLIAKVIVPAQAATGIQTNFQSWCVLLTLPCDASTVSHGSTAGTHAFWFESGSFLQSTGVAFGPNGRWLVVRKATGGAITASKKHVLSIPTALKSLGGGNFVPTRISSTNQDQYDFTTGTGTDSTAPTLSTIAPANGSTGQSPTTAVTLTFSEEIDPSSVTSSTINLKDPSNNVLGATLVVSDDLKTVTLSPHAELATTTTYTTTITAGVRDLFGNAISSITRTFQTQGTTDSTKPTIDLVRVEELPADVDGSGTFIAGKDSTGSAGSATAFDVYLPRSGFLLEVTYSDLGGSGIDPTKLSVKCNKAVGSNSANAELRSNFTATHTGASWRIPSGSLVAVGDDATFTFTIDDVSGNTSTSAVITVDIADKDATASGAGGGDHDPFDSRQTWVLRTDLDAYTHTLQSQTTPSAQAGVTTTVSSNNIRDLDESLWVIGLGGPSTTAAAAVTVNGPSKGTNAIIARLFAERLREVLRERFEIEQDGTRDTQSMDIEFLLSGEQGSLTGLPTHSTSNSSNTSKAFSEMSLGGTPGADSSNFGTFSLLGQAFVDDRNRRQEANINTGSGSLVGIFTTVMFESHVSDGAGSPFFDVVSANFVTVHGGTPVGQDASDDDVLAGSFDRTTSSNTTHNARYDAIFDALEAAALYVSSVTAHEIGHSTGLTPDSGPKTGLFGDARRENTFTESTSTSPNTPGHLDFLGNDIMPAASFVDDALLTGTEFERFNPLDRAYLRGRLIYDEGK